MDENHYKATRNHLFWVAAHRSEIEAWRDTLTLLDRDMINHPTALRRRWDAALDHGADQNAPKKKRSPTREALVRLNEELRAEIARLKRMIEQGDRSLFDLPPGLGR